MESSELREAKGQREFGRIGGGPCVWHDFPLQVAEVERAGVSCWWQGLGKRLQRLAQEGH